MTAHDHTTIVKGCHRCELHVDSLLAPDDCEHEAVMLNRKDGLAFWECGDCGEPFITQADADLVIETSQAVSSDLLWRFHERALAAATAGLEVAEGHPLPGVGLRAYAPDDGHTHQYDSSMEKCILCGRSPFIGG